MPTTTGLQKSQLVAQPVAKSQDWLRSNSATCRCARWVVRSRDWSHYQSYDWIKSLSPTIVQDRRRVVIRPSCDDPRFVCDLLRPWIVQQVFWNMFSDLRATDSDRGLPTVAETRYMISPRLSATCTLTWSYIGRNVVARQMRLNPYGHCRWPSPPSLRSPTLCKISNYDNVLYAYFIFFPIKYVSYHRHFLSAKQRNNFVSVLFPF